QKQQPEPFIVLLTEALAEIIEVDRHWYDDGDPRNNPEFFVEAFQRLILRFIIANRGKKFMTLPIDPEPRVPAEGSRGLSLTRTSLAVSTSNQGTSSGKKRSRDIRDNEDKGGEGGQEGNEGEEGAQRNDDKRKRRRARTEAGTNEAGTSEQGISDECLIEFLIQGQAITIPSPPNGVESVKREFLKVMNSVAVSVRELHFQSSPLLVFKTLKDYSLRGHYVYNTCRPSFVAAWEDHFNGDQPPPWPLIRLVGEDTRKKKSRSLRKALANSYLHYLLLARPDLHVALGMFISNTEIVLQVGIGGYGIRNLRVNWNSKDLSRLLYAFIYRLYDPGQFADPTYATEASLLPDLVTYTITLMVEIKIDGVPTGEKRAVSCRNFAPTFASNPFGTRTHVLWNPESDVMLGNKRLHVFKDQLCDVGTRSDKYAVIERAHNSETIPGVVGTVYHEMHLYRAWGALHCSFAT
ncbi:hypothetical protein FRB90_008015, partial [Tulasnella sp. 427]